MNKIFNGFSEWQIGSKEGGDDVFPRVKVGISSSKKANIRNGELWIDDVSLNASVGAYAQINSTNTTNKIDQSFFNMEPGLCLHVELYAVGRSHLSSSINTKPTCISRELFIRFATQNTSVTRYDYSLPIIKSLKRSAD